MKIHQWLNNPMSTINGVAVVEVEGGEVADAEKMLTLVDSAPGFFGYTIELVSTDDPPTLRQTKYGKDTNTQHGFVHMPELQQRVRYYKVFVNRD